MITIQDLQFFIKTAQELHFAKAANLLGVRYKKSIHLDFEIRFFIPIYGTVTKR